ncbi:HdeA/HdeB family protein [Pseudomonas taetrolens]|uniref:Probable acid stress chaperone HdeA n=1 Tax=Pseudomonas taetrolens TaxID=47884 RepID=A0A0J6GST8_PSETA|nr:acid-activated periplasmic chaperone HdeA [Pseudomonas taetrolens]KMM85159.1 HdeA [Pseudomonas taetrolens]SEC46535.1 HdeA/HdeB family protein [Pseudomonas taetrolens]SQF86618.1 10K-S protein [Pseudomonas taetrolens]VEH49694.1 10K-S protein [Pseudomonas taetrolens]
MKKHCLMMAAVSLAALSTLAQAADTKQPVSQWTCEDFLAVDDSFKPTAVGLGEVVNKSGKVEDAVLDVDGVEKITPLIVTACEKDQKTSFVQKLKEEWSKVKKDA